MSENERDVEGPFYSRANSGGSRFSLGGALKGPPAYYLANVFKKLHENEDMLVGGGERVSGAPPPPPPRKMPGSESFTRWLIGCEGERMQGIVPLHPPALVSSCPFTLCPLPLCPPALSPCAPALLLSCPCPPTLVGFPPSQECSYHEGHEGCKSR